MQGGGAGQGDFAKMGDVVILGASARAAAFSALRAGLRPWCVDLFADADLAACCEVRRLERRYPQAFEDVIDDGPAGPWMYTGGLENYPRLVDRLASRRVLWGNAGDVLRRARDPEVLAFAARAAGVPAPALGLSPARGRWLVKPRGGAGGAGIRFWGGPATAVGRHEYVQEHVEGDSYSLVFCGWGGAMLLGVTRQLVGEDWLGAPAFRYCGSVGPVRLAFERELRELGSWLAKLTRMRGLFGVDGVLREGKFWPVEVNPRYPASVEVLERATGMLALEWHRSVFEQRVPRPWGEREAPGSPGGVVGKVILYARREIIVPAGLAVLRTAAKQPELADLPHPGERIDAGRPILTLFANAPDVDSCLGELRARAAALEARLYAD